MTDWVLPELDLDIHIETSEKGFTIDEITVKWLYHYIKYSDTGPSSDQKLLLIDNHYNHEIGELIRLVNQNNILPYPLLLYSSHYIQPYDIELFGPYKHQQDKKLNETITRLDIEYHLKAFLKDLSWVREQTFKKETIKNTFQKSGIYPPSFKACLELLRTFTPPKKELDLPLHLSLQVQPKIPIKTTHTEFMFIELENKILELLSSTTKPKVQSLIKGIKEILTYS